LCQLSNIDFEQKLITCLYDIRLVSLVYAHAWIWHYFIGLSKIKTVDSAQPRNRSIATRPFSLWEGGVRVRDCDEWFQNHETGNNIYTVNDRWNVCYYV